MVHIILNHASVQPLRYKTEDIPSALRNLSTLIASLRTALVGEGLVKGSERAPPPARSRRWPASCSPAAARVEDDGRLVRSEMLYKPVCVPPSDPEL
jgi:hypothetical protein